MRCGTDVNFHFAGPGFDSRPQRMIFLFNKTKSRAQQREQGQILQNQK
jgi:hypothetical protein